MNALKGNKVGMMLGITAAIVHAIWAAFVWLMPEVAQKFAEFDMALHFLKMDVAVQPFSWGGAVALIVFAFCAGYIVGRIFAAVHNSVARR